jgi:ferredoxin-type protein NapH
MSVEARDRGRPGPPRFGIAKSILVTVPMMLLTAAMLTGGQALPKDPLLLASTAFTWLLLNFVFFRMLSSGRTFAYRSGLFITLAIAFVIAFSTALLSTRGSLALTDADVLQGKTPFCHLVIPMVIIPGVLTRTIIFPGTLVGTFASIGSMLVLWIGATLALGRAWCSWICFYGGLDEGFSRIGKRPRIKSVGRAWTYLPFALLIAVVLISAVSLSPFYCEWLCPFKAVTEAPAVTNALILFQTILFVGLFLATVVVLPLLLKRRAQCGLFCPFGAFQSFTSAVSAFDVRIDTTRCTACGLCVRTCPTFSLTDESVAAGRTLITCTRCGKCVDICPAHAVSYHIKGTRVGASPNVARTLFLLPAFVFLSAIGGGMISTAIWRLLKLATTGSMF